VYIICKKKDYYDGVAGTTGIDKSIVYDRQIIEFDRGVFPKEFGGYVGVSNPKLMIFGKLNNVDVKPELRIVYPHISPFIIGFCGKLYVGWKLYEIGTTNKKSYLIEEFITTISYDNDNIKKLVKPYYWRGNFEDDLNYILSYDPIEMFRELNTPVFVYDHDYGRTDIEKYWRDKPKFIINPLLKEYQFYKVFDAVQAFQEISMFLGGVLGNREKEIVNVEDKYKITQHGFDKWSFRKEPQNK